MKALLLLAGVLLAGCIQGGYPEAYAAIPACPGAGLSHFELETPAWNDANASAAFHNKGWQNVSVRYVGVGGFGSPDTTRYMTADCNLENQVRRNEP